MNRKWILLITIALAAVMMLTGCGKENAAEESPAPSASAETAATETPVSTTEAPAATTTQTETKTGYMAGDRYEGTVTLEGMEQTVRYEQIVNETMGFAMGYDYERFERHSENDRERIVLQGEDPENPEVYLEVTRRAEDAETTAASILETLSGQYAPTREAFTLDRAGDCIVIHADVDTTGEMTMEELQVVYIIPASGGCFVAWGHNTMDSADAFGALFRGMMHTFVVLK